MDRRTAGRIPATLVDVIGARVNSIARLLAASFDLRTGNNIHGLEQSEFNWNREVSDIISVFCASTRFVRVRAGRSSACNYASEEMPLPLHHPSRVSRSASLRRRFPRGVAPTLVRAPLARQEGASTVARSLKLFSHNRKARGGVDGSPLAARRVAPPAPPFPHASLADGVA